YVPDNRPTPLPFAGAVLEALAEFIGARQQILFFEQVEHRQSCGARKWVAGECAAEAAGAWCIHDLGAAGHSSQWEAAAQGFRCHDEIGLDAVTLAGEHRAGAAEAGLHLVGDEEDSVVVAEIDENLEVVRRRSDE